MGLATSLDHLVGADEECWRHGEADCLRDHRSAHKAGGGLLKNLPRARANDNYE
jgi:hypothetical protein